MVDLRWQRANRERRQAHHERIVDQLRARLECAGVSLGRTKLFRKRFVQKIRRDGRRDAVGHNQVGARVGRVVRALFYG